MLIMHILKKYILNILMHMLYRYYIYIDIYIYIYIYIYIIYITLNYFNVDILSGTFRFS